MKRYEMVHEIFNLCANNQMRDVFFKEIDVEDTDAFMQDFCKGKEIECRRSDFDDGTIIYDLVTDGMMQRVTFSEI